MNKQNALQKVERAKALLDEAEAELSQAFQYLEEQGIDDRDIMEGYVFGTVRDHMNSIFSAVDTS
jgi:hypothetical protein